LNCHSSIPDCPKRPRNPLTPFEKGGIKAEEGDSSPLFKGG